MDLRGIGEEDVGWIHIAWYRTQRQVVMNMVMEVHIL
jgi:hypothetical protein